METLVKSDLVQFVDMMTAKGWVNANTGAGYKAALSKILADVPSDEDVRKIDVKTALLRYNNLHPGELSPPSLKAYGQRVEQAIGHFVSWKTDPTAFKPPQRSVTSAGAEKSESGKTKGSNRAGSVPAMDATAAGAATSNSDHVMATATVRPVFGTATETNLALPFPLRPNYLAQIVIPRDMTTDEADRLCAFIKTLAQVKP
jgi:hypothetical protein